MSDRVLVVTGGSRGIGAATAEALAGAGAHVILTARKADDLEAVEERIHAAGGSATIAPMDLTERESVFNQTDLTTKIDMGPFVRHTLLAGVEVSSQISNNQRDPSSGNYPLLPVPFTDPVTSQVPAWGTTPGPLQHSTLDVAGVYVQDQIEITKYIDVIGGVRFDDVAPTIGDDGVRRQLLAAHDRQVLPAGERGAAGRRPRKRDGGDGRGRRRGGVGREHRVNGPESGDQAGRRAKHA